MEADFSGYATKAGVRCTDGRTIMPNAFQEQHQMKVPLVWQHGHADPENVLGHAILENRADGVYAYGFFNESAKATHAKQMLKHGDITMMSIWANKLVERSGRVLHGAIREVSLVLSGANPGAVIESVTIRHSDGDVELIDDEAIIFSGEELELQHSSTTTNTTTDDGELTIQDVVDSMDDNQREVLHHLVGEALSASATDEDGISHAMGPDATIQDVLDSMSEEQLNVLHFLVGEALSSSDGNLKQDNIDSTDKEGTDMTGSRNVFEKDDAANHAGATLSHGAIKEIVADATKTGSLKESFENYVLQHGINDIELLFPEATQLTNSPEFFARRMEWVNNVLGGARKTPFSRIKTATADLTFEEARAKGYIKGNLKREEFFRVSKRTTTPQTVYKKQKLDRDDIIDITDFDVVMWMKGEMRIMLDEELARAILVGDGRDPGDDDKISEEHIRPIANDDDFYTITANVNLLDASSSISEVSDAIIMHRQYMRGSGLPTFYTTESVIAKFMLLRDTLGRRIYQSLDQVVSELRVKEIVPVEVLNEYPDIVGILVNMQDYVIGADSGGQVSLFDDFDIDYNQYKYLIETRVSGALTRPKAAMVVKAVASGSDVLLAPADAPTFDEETGVITLPTSTNFTWKDGDGNTLSDGAQSALAVGASMTVVAVADSGYYFASSENDEWTFTRP